MTLRYRVIADEPTWSDGGTVTNCHHFRRGDVLVRQEEWRRDSTPTPDSDGDVYMQIEGAAEYDKAGHIQLSQLQLITEDADPAPVTDDLVPFETYQDAAARLDLTDEFARVAQLADALHLVATAGPVKDNA